MQNETKTLPVWFWVVAVIALLWNGLGVMAYIADVSQSPADLATQGELIETLYAQRPAWAVGAFAIAVFAGLLGAISLLFRKHWASLMFLVSLIALVIQNVYWFGIAKAYTLFPANTQIMPALVFLIAIFLLWYARSSNSKGWLR